MLARAVYPLGRFVGVAAAGVEKAFPLGGRWRARAPDEGEVSGKHPLISHLR